VADAGRVAGEHAGRLEGGSVGGYQAFHVGAPHHRRVSGGHVGGHVPVAGVGSVEGLLRAGDRVPHIVPDVGAWGDPGDMGVVVARAVAPLLRAGRAADVRRRAPAGRWLERRARSATHPTASVANER